MSRIITIRRKHPAIRKCIDLYQEYGPLNFRGIALHPMLYPYLYYHPGLILDGITPLVAKRR